MSHTVQHSFKVLFIVFVRERKRNFQTLLDLTTPAPAEIFFPFWVKLANAIKGWVASSSCTLFPVATQSNLVVEILYLANPEIGKKGIWGLFLP